MSATVYTLTVRAEGDDQQKIRVLVALTQAQAEIETYGALSEIKKEKED
jgi:hypothetical protein